MRHWLGHVCFDGTVRQKRRSARSVRPGRCDGPDTGARQRSARGSAGRALSDKPIGTGYCHYLLLNAQRVDAPEIAAYARWLVAESARGPMRQS